MCLFCFSHSPVFFPPCLHQCVCQVAWDTAITYIFYDLACAIYDVTCGNDLWQNPGEAWPFFFSVSLFYVCLFVSVCQFQGWEWFRKDPGSCLFVCVVCRDSGGLARTPNNSGLGFVSACFYARFFFNWDRGLVRKGVFLHLWQVHQWQLPLITPLWGLTFFLQGRGAGEWWRMKDTTS